MTDLALPENDVTTIRRPAEKKARLAEDPLNVERRDAWYAHDAGSDSRPMILALGLRLRLGWEVLSWDL